MKRNENIMNYTEETIRARCEELAKQYWDMNFDLGIIITDELPEVTLSTFDYYEIDNKKVPVSITFSNKLFQGQSEEIIEAVFKYGLANWANTVRGIPNRNNDIEFLIELARVGGYIDGRIMKYGDTVHTVLCKCCD